MVDCTIFQKTKPVTKKERKLKKTVEGKEMSEVAYLVLRSFRGNVKSPESHMYLYPEVAA